MTRAASALAPWLAGLFTSHIRSYCPHQTSLHVLIIPKGHDDGMTGQKRDRATSEGIKGTAREAPIALQADQPPIRNDDNAYHRRCNEAVEKAPPKMNRTKTLKSGHANDRCLHEPARTVTSMEDNAPTGQLSVDLEELNAVIRQSITRAVQYPFFWSILPEEYAGGRRSPLDSSSKKKLRTGQKGVQMKATNCRSVETQQGEHYMDGKHEEGDEITAFEVWYEALDD